jgi:hypothetical protein
MLTRKRYPLFDSIGSIGPKIVRNSWRRHGFSFFPGEPEEFVPVVDDSLENIDIAEEEIENLPDDDNDDSLIDTLIFERIVCLGATKTSLFPLKTRKKTRKILEIRWTTTKIEYFYNFADNFGL